MKHHTLVIMKFEIVMSRKSIIFLTKTLCENARTQKMHFYALLFTFLPP